MFRKGLLVKISVGFLALFGVFGTMAYYSGFHSPADWASEYPKSIFDDLVKKDGPEIIVPGGGGFDLGPKAPEIVDEKVEGSCGTMIYWYDNELNEDNVYFYRRIVGEANFTPIKVTGPHLGGPGSFGEANLPVGVYEYQVSVKNEIGEEFSNISNPIAITEEVCNNWGPILPKPLNPVITAMEKLKPDLCSVRIYFQDNSDNEDGIRIYREEWNTPKAVIAELPPNNAPTGTYDDLNLPPGHYQYQLSVYNANGESFSQVSDEVEIKANCQPVTTGEITPTVTPKPKESTAPQACVWTAAINVFVREGPNKIYKDITAVEAGTEFPVVGQSEDQQYWVVELKPGVYGYVPKGDRFGTTSGNCDVPVMTDPPAPRQPDNNNNNHSAPPQCSDGVDNDNDGYIDLPSHRPE